MAPVIRDVIDNLKTPAAFHLDHGVGMPEVVRAIRYGATGVMIDASLNPLDENIRITKEVVGVASAAGVSVEGELGHIGSTKDETWAAYTEVADAVRYAEETGVDALAVMVGTAHGKYKKAPVLAIDRIAEIHKAVRVFRMIRLPLRFRPVFAKSTSVRMCAVRLLKGMLRWTRITLRWMWLCTKRRNSSRALRLIKFVCSEPIVIRAEKQRIKTAEEFLRPFFCSIEKLRFLNKKVRS